MSVCLLHCQAFVWRIHLDFAMYLRGGLSGQMFLFPSGPQGGNRDILAALWICCPDTAIAKAAAESSKEYWDQTGDPFEGRASLSCWRKVSRCAAERQKCALGSCEKGQCEWIKGTRVNFSSATQGSGVCDYICRNKWLQGWDVTESLMQLVFNYCNEHGWVSSQTGFYFFSSQKMDVSKSSQCPVGLHCKICPFSYRFSLKKASRNGKCKSEKYAVLRFRRTSFKKQIIFYIAWTECL